MIYITGDTHQLNNIEKIKNFILKNKVSKEDYLIIVGDVCCPEFCQDIPYGKVYNFWIDIPMQILFIDGNHENFQSLNKLPIEEWNGGNIHRLAPNIIHLMRGQVFTIEEKKFFTMGGAISPDRMKRFLGIDYFEEEDCSYNETKIALDNLEKHNNQVDYILTHTIGDDFFRKNMLTYFHFYIEYSGAINRFLDYIDDVVDYKHWYFGHFHKDIVLDNKHTLIFNFIKKIK